MLSEISESFKAMNEFIEKGAFSEVPASCAATKDLDSDFWSKLDFINSSIED